MVVTEHFPLPSPSPARSTITLDGDVVTLDDLIRRAANLWPAKRAWQIELSDDQLTFEDINNRSWALGASIMEVTGARPGDRVAVAAPNTLDFPLTWLALTRRGLTMVPLNPRYGAKDLAHVLDLSEPVALLVASTLRESVSTSLGDTDLSVHDLGPLVAGTTGAPTPPAEVPYLDPSLGANIQFTSGTTGRPKGCELGHDYWLGISQTLVEDFPHLGPDDVMLTAQPFYYLDPQWNVSAALYGGCELVLLDGFHPSTFWERVRHYGVTYFYCLGLMPTLLLKMPEHPDDLHHSVRAIEASAIPPGLHRALEQRWGVPWLEAFGMTETGADIYVPPEMNEELIGSGCLGITRPHREALVLDSQGKPCEPGTIGELYLAGPGMMRGYFRDPEATTRAFREGWFATGDLVERDGQGRLYHRGRSKDMIRRSGENIAAVEVEDTLSGYPEVGTAAVVGIPDDLRGEEVFALVVPHGSVASIAEESPSDFIAALRTKCEKDLAPFKVPRYWLLVDSLPRSASERLLKTALDIPRLFATALDTNSPSGTTRYSESHDQRDGVKSP